MRAVQDPRRLTPRGKNIQAIQSRLLREVSGSHGKYHDNCSPLQSDPLWSGQGAHPNPEVGRNLCFKSKILA